MAAGLRTWTLTSGFGDQYATNYTKPPTNMHLHHLFLTEIGNLGGPEGNWTPVQIKILNSLSTSLCYFPLSKRVNRLNNKNFINIVASDKYPLKSHQSSILFLFIWRFILNQEYVQAKR